MDLERLIKRVWIGFFFGLLVMIGIAVWGDVSALGSSFSKLGWPYLLLIFSFTFVGYLFRFAKWQLYIRSIGVYLSLKDSVLVFLSGFSMSITPGKAGEVLKSFLLKRMHQIDIARTAPIVLAERSTDLLAMVLLASIGVSRFSYGYYVLGGTLLFLLALILIIQSRGLTLWMLSKLKQVKKLLKLAEKLEVFYESSYTLFHWRILSLATLISVVSWFLECISLYWVFKGLGISLGLLDAVFSFSFSSIAGAISMLPGGLGAAETSMVGILMTLGVEKGDAVAATLLGRFGTLWFGVFLGVATLIVSSRKLLRIEGKSL
ncbi:lysylphosphatidylglycerol synthase transmembrane domain-containing protein [Ammoniphilus sp. CFH 90114]|uniref:lysylphosphatidylglycerol synthase transmembrane domain-containing protein n=1 Tax=Ammoniphilus sp. CFH 90114 TaxID=2493665 RepID=UPI00100FC041|nr:lysylphosphatidylglycerol synthase transmembrane domain-containing protein [Ammoniphilus sp. CFH 90114]RXT04522.1 flippase-like domain-containing protein [Ammoniphilus sp. CFH 90114]